MDIKRPSNARQRTIRAIIFCTVALLAVAGLAYGVSHLRPAEPIVDKSAIWTDDVKRGALLREVRGTGSLVPEEIRWIPSQTDGRVDRIPIRPGAIVKPDTVIVELTNPELERDVQTAGYQLKGAEADYSDLKAQLNNDFLKQKAAAAITRSQYDQAALQSNVDELFLQKGMGSELKAKLSKGTVEQLGIQLQMQEDTVKSAADSTAARLLAGQSKIDQQRSMYELKRARLDALHVRAGVDGVLQQVSVEVGQQVGSGTNLARVANPKKLQAQIMVAESQIRDVLVGQKVSLDTHNGILTGRVTRIAPTVVGGTVTADVEILDPLPRDARPDLSVDGSIEIAQLRNVLYVSRPVHAQESATLSLFRLVDGGASAVRQTVKLGRSSADSIEIVEGFREGDKVILSDMSAWDSYDRIKVK